MMKKTIFFDLDMTLVNTSSLANLRRERNWSKVYSSFSQTSPYIGASGLLESLKAKCTVGIITSSPRTYAERLLTFHNLKIEVFAAYHDTMKHKPDPEPINYSIAKLGISIPYEVYYIGDEETDIIAANSADNVISIGVTWGVKTDADLRIYNPKYIVNTFNDLKSLLL